MIIDKGLTQDGWVTIDYIDENSKVTIRKMYPKFDPWHIDHKFIYENLYIHIHEEVFEGILELFSLNKVILILEDMEESSQSRTDVYFDCHNDYIFMSKISNKNNIWYTFTYKDIEKPIKKEMYDVLLNKLGEYEDF